jgi:hypothetical protein
VPPRAAPRLVRRALPQRRRAPAGGLGRSARPPARAVIPPSERREGLERLLAVHGRRVGEGAPARTPPGVCLQAGARVEMTMAESNLVRDQRQHRQDDGGKWWRWREMVALAGNGGAGGKWWRWPETVCGSRASENVTYVCYVTS